MKSDNRINIVRARQYWWQFWRLSLSSLLKIKRSKIRLGNKLIKDQLFSDDINLNKIDIDDGGEQSIESGDQSYYDPDTECNVVIVEPKIITINRHKERNDMRNMQY